MAAAPIGGSSATGSGMHSVPMFATGVGMTLVGGGLLAGSITRNEGAGARTRPSATHIPTDIVPNARPLSRGEQQAFDSIVAMQTPPRDTVPYARALSSTERSQFEAIAAAEGASLTRGSALSSAESFGARIGRAFEGPRAGMVGGALLLTGAALGVWGLFGPPNG